MWKEITEDMSRIMNISVDEIMKNSTPSVRKQIEELKGEGKKEISVHKSYKGNTYAARQRTSK